MCAPHTHRHTHTHTQTHTQEHSHTHTTGLYNISPSFMDSKQVGAADHHICSCVQTNICQSSKKQQLLIKMKRVPLKRWYLEHRQAVGAGFNVLTHLVSCVFHKLQENVCGPRDTKSNVRTKQRLFGEVANTEELWRGNDFTQLYTTSEKLNKETARTLGADVRLFDCDSINLVKKYLNS